MAGRERTGVTEGAALPPSSIDRTTVAAGVAFGFALDVPAVDAAACATDAEGEPPGDVSDTPEGAGPGA